MKMLEQLQEQLADQSMLARKIACSGAKTMTFCETRRQLDLARCERRSARSARLTLAGPACAALARAIRRRRGVWLIAPYVRLGEPTALLTPRGT